MIELLAVIAILTILTVMICLNAPALLGATGLSQGSQVVSDTLNFARDSAITKNVSTVVVIRRTGSNLWQRVAIFSISATDGTWEIVSRWQNLPSQAFIDPGYDPSTEPWTRKPRSLMQSHAKIVAPTAAIKDADQTLNHDADYYAIGFYPNGGLICDENAALRIVQGRNNNGVIEIQGGAAPSNWAKLVIEKVTGQVKELRAGQ